MICHPSDSDLSVLVRCNMLKNCPLAAPDIAIAKIFYDSDIAGVSRGKGVCRSPRPAVSNYVAILQQIHELNRVLNISADVMFINGLPFFLTRSRNVRFLTADAMPSRSKAQLISSLKPG